MGKHLGWYYNPDSERSLTFGEQLREIRRQALMTRAEMRKVLFDIPEGTYDAWEYGQRVPPIWCQNLVFDRIKNVIG